jgi:predicted metal-dependent hydrolase
MKFEVPAAADFHPLYIAGSAALSYSHTAFGLYVAVLEPFAVKSFRRVLDQIRDEALRENVERFSRQEAQHYQRHIDFNKVVLAHGYPGLEQRLDRLRADLEGFLGDALPEAEQSGAVRGAGGVSDKSPRHRRLLDAVRGSSGRGKHGDRGEGRGR